MCLTLWPGALIILLNVYSVYLEYVTLLSGCTVRTLKCFAQFYFSLCIFNSRISIRLATATRVFRRHPVPHCQQRAYWLMAMQF